MGQAAPGARHGRNGRLVTQRVRPGKMESGYSAAHRRLAPSHADSLMWTEVWRRGCEGGCGLTDRSEPLRTPHMCLRAASHCARSSRPLMHHTVHQANQTTTEKH